MHPLSGALVEGAYYFTSFSGKIYSVDLPRGVARHLHTFTRSSSSTSSPMYDVTENAVYRLDQSPDPDSGSSFSRYVFKTDEEQALFNVSPLDDFHAKGAVVQGIAVNPDWDSKIQ